MAGEAGRLIAATLAFATVTAGAALAPGPVRDMAGRYRQREARIEVIPVDDRHAYVHIFFRFGLLNDKICEFEGVAGARGNALVYDHLSSGDEDPPCKLLLRREGRKLTWAAADLSCTQYCPNRSLADGDLPWSSRRPVSRSAVLKGEGTRGYADTVAAWRSLPPRP